MKEEVTVVCPSNVTDRNEISQAPCYLINKIEDYVYFIYKEITREEKNNKKIYEVLHHKNQVFLLVGHTSSKEKAIVFIQGYKEDVLQLD